MLAQELSRIRLVGSSKLLRPFAQRLESWELLLVVYMLSGDGRYGIEDYLDQLQTLKCTRLTMRKFVRDRVADGAFLIVDADKKSRKALALSEELQREFEDCFNILKAPADLGGIDRYMAASKFEPHSDVEL